MDGANIQHSTPNVQRSGNLRLIRAHGGRRLVEGPRLCESLRRPRVCPAGDLHQAQRLTAFVRCCGSQTSATRSGLRLCVLCAFALRTEIARSAPGQFSTPRRQDARTQEHQETWFAAIRAIRVRPSTLTSHPCSSRGCGIRGQEDVVESGWFEVSRAPDRGADARPTGAPAVTRLRA